MGSFRAVEFIPLENLFNLICRLGNGTARVRNLLLDFAPF